MDVARRRDSDEIRQWWSTAPDLDENALQTGILQLLRTIHEAAADDDWDTVKEHVRLYELGESYCKEEPQLSTYEFGQMGIGVMYASNSISRGEYAKAAEEIKKIHETYSARMQRYEALGVPPRRASEVRNNFLLKLADLKWIGPEEWRDFLMTPEEVLDQIQETHERIISFINANPGFHSNERSLKESLALCELVGLKMALRYAPARVPDLVRMFNEHYSDLLALPTSHYKLANAAEADKSAYYWDFELAKLRMSKEAPAQDIYMCIELRSLAARNTFGDWKIQGLLRGWRREALTIVRELKARQEKA
jgi:hypothetical protein